MTREERAKMIEEIEAMPARERHLKAIKGGLMMAGVDANIVLGMVLGVTTGLGVLHFDDFDIIMDYLDKSLNNEDLASLALSLSMLTIKMRAEKR